MFSSTQLSIRMSIASFCRVTVNKMRKKGMCERKVPDEMRFRLHKMCIIFNKE